ncbi:MAG: inovirus Gp2 family protein [Glaciimonas sp.]|nr:inovirus Gp2 family protein [Glaciimonas sp.]
MIRHPINSNLTLHYEDNYLGFPVQFDKGPFIREYLNRLHQTVSSAIGQYPRVFAFRFDLRLPPGMNPHGLSYENKIIERFIESFKAKIKYNRQMAFRDNKYAHDSVVRYVWTREVGQRGRPHYHIAILLNYDAYCALGKFEPGRDNMFNRLQDAWASALDLPLEAIVGLLEIPAKPKYFIYRYDNESIAQFFYRASYLCKSATKSFGNGSHGFGASRT